MNRGDAVDVLDAAVDVLDAAVDVLDAADAAGPADAATAAIAAAAFRHPGRARLGQVVAAVAARPDRWSGLVRFDAGRRWFRRLVLTDDYEVWLLSWMPGQDTGFHDHGSAAGAFVVTSGRVRERTVSRPGRVRHRTVAPGEVRSFGSRHVHDVVNAFAEPAVTMHAYSPPLTAMRRYELTGSGLVYAATEHAERDW
jgi:mannose-6-phosphate isomerase-like protein (cupin superfamily)